MGREIERKYLVKSQEWKKDSKGILIKQGYLSTSLKRIVRVRIEGKKGFLTVKSMRSDILRDEFEYEIPYKDADYLLKNICIKPLIEKKRYKINFHGMTWEIDEFDGANKGLIIAEIELSSKSQQFEKPIWIGEEVTGEPKYLNVNLVKTPFNTWN
jgi:CYTH domain-containing protein